MTQLHAIDLSKANRQTVDTQKSKPLSVPKAIRPSDIGEIIIYGQFSPLRQEAQPGVNIATVPLSPNHWVVSAFPVELNPGDSTPHVGDAIFQIIAVGVDTNASICQVIYNLQWGNALPVGLMMILGYIPL